MSVQVLHFSGGWQSSALAWMVIRGEIETPKHFAIVNADTGDERSLTYDYVSLIRGECKTAGVTFITADGPKITDDYRESDASRIETIPYWTKNPDGSKGQLMQACTRHYKIRPMRRAVDQWLSRMLYMRIGNVRRIPVTCWVGFAHDEQSRIIGIKEDSARWRTRFPLNELNMSKEDCVGYIRNNGLPEPIPSVCAGCFSHGLRSLEWMYNHDHEAWLRAVDRDKFIRNGLAKYRVKNPCYVSDTLIPLEELAERGFRLSNAKETAEHQCSSGSCFV